METKNLCKKHDRRWDESRSTYDSEEMLVETGSGNLAVSFKELPDLRQVLRDVWHIRPSLSIKQVHDPLVYSFMLSPVREVLRASAGTDRPSFLHESLFSLSI